MDSKKILFGCLLLISMRVFVFGQSQIYIALNPNDCTSCVNRLALLERWQQNNIINIIVQESNKPFEEELRSVLPFKNRVYTFLFNDSLYNQFIGKHSLSTIQILTKDLIRTTKSYPIKSELDQSLLTYFSCVLSDSCSIAFQSRLTMLAVEPIVQGLGEGYIYSQKLPFILKMNFKEANIDTFATITQEIRESAYKSFFGREEKFTSLLQVLDERQITKSSIKGISYLNNEQIVASVQYPILRFKNNFKDTILSRFSALHTFNIDGQLVSTEVLDTSIIRSKSDYYYARSSHFFYGSDRLMISVINPEKKSGTQLSNFIGYYKKNDLNLFRFEALYPQLLPLVYKDYGYFYSHPFFSQDGVFVAVALSDVVFNIKTGEKHELNAFSLPQFNGDKFKQNYYVNSLNEMGGKLYFTYYDQSANQNKLRLLIYDINGRRKISDTVLLDREKNKGIHFLFLDQYDPNYLYFRTSDTEVLRIKADKTGFL